MLNNVEMKVLFPLSSKVTVYVPSTMDVDNPIDNTKYVDGVAKRFSEWFGGATSTPTIGYYSSQKSGLVKERSVMVFAYCSDTDLQEHIEEVIQLCVDLCISMKQESIALEVNGKMALIDRSLEEA